MLKFGFSTTLARVSFVVSRFALVVVDYVTDICSDCCYSSNMILSSVEYKESPYFAPAVVLCNLGFCGF